MKKFIYICIMGVVMLGCCELAFRVAGFYPALPLDNDKPSVQAYYWVCDQDLGWCNRGDGSYDYELIASNPNSTTDKNGFRNGYGWDPSGANPIVLFIGDSFVFGAEVEDDQTITSEVAKQLEPELNMRVLNSGVRGYSTVQSKRMMEKCLRRYSNIVAVVYCYCGNDAPENIDPDAYKPAKAPIAKLNKETGELTEIDVSDPAVSWGSDFSELMDKERQELVKRLANKRWDQTARDRMREHSAFFHAINEMLSDLKDGDDEEDNVAVEGHADDDSESDYARDVLIALLREMEGACEKKNVSFVVTSATTSGDLQGIDLWCETAAVDFIDVSAGFTKSKYSYMARRRDRVYDSHYNPRGTKTFAKEFTPQFKEIIYHPSVALRELWRAGIEHKEHKENVAHELHE